MLIRWNLAGRPTARVARNPNSRAISGMLTSDISGTMPKKPWVLWKKTVFFFQPKNRFTVDIIYTVLETILNFLIPRQKWLIRVHHIEMLRELFGRATKQTKNNTNIYNDTISIGPQLVDQPCWPLTGISENTKTWLTSQKHITISPPSFL